MANESIAQKFRSYFRRQMASDSAVLTSEQLLQKYSDGVRVCPSYLRELVILSNGDVTTCCLDAKGENTLGNCHEKPLQEIWSGSILPWHQKNIQDNLNGCEWQSPLCNTCFRLGVMKPFGVEISRDPDKVALFHQETPPFPSLSLVIEPTAGCNYKCWGCYTGLGQISTRTTKILKIDKFKENILPVIHLVGQVRLYNYGETFLHPDIIEMITLMRAANPTMRIDISTNGMLMNEAIADALIDSKVNYLSVSMHGGHTQEGLMKYALQGADVDVVAKNVKYLTDAKRKRGAKLPWVFLKALLLEWNDSEEEMEGFLRFGKNLGADFTGWDLNASDPARSSKRVAPGTEAYSKLVERKLLLKDFYRDFPAWP